MRAVFIGCVESSRRTLEALIASNVVELGGVVTKQCSAFNADFFSLAALAERHRIPCFIEIGNNQEALVEWLESVRPEIIFCVGWPYLLKAGVLRAAQHGVIGYHPTDLPYNRGRHPIIWSLALGLNKTASTFFLMVEAADAGPVVDKIPVLIGQNDSAADLYDRLMEVAEQQIVRIAQRITAGTLNFEPQDTSRGNVWRKRSKRDGLIDWRMPSQGIYNLVRALAKPYIGAHCEYDGAEIKIWQVRPAFCAEHNLEPGKVLRVEGSHFVVKTGDSAVEIIKHEFPNLPEVGAYL